MKDYELKAILKQKLSWLGGKRDKRYSDIKCLERDLKRTKEQHQLIEQSFVDEIKRQQQDFDALEVLLDDLKKEYAALITRELEAPRKVEKMETEDDDGKVECSICGERYAPQGIKTHEIACKRKKLEEELKLLEG